MATRAALASMSARAATCANAGSHPEAATGSTYWPVPAAEGLTPLAVLLCHQPLASKPACLPTRLLPCMPTCMPPTRHVPS